MTDERQEKDPVRPPGVPPHQPAAGERTENGVDEASEESFPSSDPPSSGTPSVSGGSRS